MNYFLLANNRDIQQATIDKLPLKPETDVLVLFNFLIPLKFTRVHNYPNKFCISRKRPIKDRLNSTLIPGLKEYYCNMGTMRQKQDLFKEIYMLPCPTNMGEHAQDFSNHIGLYDFDINKLKCIDYDMKKMSKKLNYYRTGIQAEVSTGIIANEYLQDIKQVNDTIILVAFNSGVSKFHDKNWEKQYFLNQIDQGKCLTIDSYSLPDSWT